MNKAARVSSEFMQRLTRGLMVGLLLAGLSTVAAPPAQATKAKDMGTPEAIDFAPGGLVNEILVTVKKGWLNSDAFALYITITGLNGGFELHGQDVVLVSDTTVFDTEKDLAEVVVPWTADETPQQADELYTVCVQVLVSDHPFGDQKCSDYGPF